MATEVELKLTLPPGATRRLAAHPLLAGSVPERKRVENIYYDTPDLNLARGMVAVRRRRIGGIWLLTVKSAEPASGGLACRSEWERPALPGEFNFAMVDHLALRQRLEKYAADLVPVFTTHFTRTAWRVQFAGADLELAFDRGRVEAGGRRAPICEIELELLSGDVGGLFALALALQQELPVHPSVASKAERGYALFAGASPLPVKAEPVAAEPDGNSLVAFRSMALNCLDHLQRNEAGVRHRSDPEYLHQARVALRRLRACLNLFAPLLPPEFAQTYGGLWRDFARSLNTARNWDVFVGETLPPLLAAFPGDAALRRLRTASQRRADQARRTVAEQFASEQYSRLLLDFAAALYALPVDSAPPLAEFGRRRLRKLGQQTRRLAKQLARLDAADLHRLRLCCKKLRYALEFLAPDAGKAYLGSLAKLQTAFGEFNDHVTALQLLEELQPETRPGTAAGWIAGRRALLAARLPRVVEPWLALRPPWKRS